VGHFHPENVIDNKFLEELGMGTTNDWIMDRVGIRTRRTVLPLDYIRETKNSDPVKALEVSQYTNGVTGRKAAEMAIRNAGLTPDRIGMVIAGGCSPDTIIPAESCVIADELKIEAICVDLNSACSSFGAQMHFVGMSRPEALPEYVLLVSPENNTRTIDYSDRSTAVLWGDGTSAAVVSTRVPSRARVPFTTLDSDPAGWRKVATSRVGFFKQDGPAVQGFAIKQMVESYRQIEARYPDRTDRIIFIGHQANLTMLQSICRRCGITEDRHFYNVDEFGNTGAAGAVIVLSQRWRDFRGGDIVAFVTVGAGLTWASMAIEFHDL
jgi:3-oxoacyl-[acyl-carrier-protein] synthase-3